VGKNLIVNDQLIYWFLVIPGLLKARLKPQFPISKNQFNSNYSAIAV